MPDSPTIRLHEYEVRPCPAMTARQATQLRDRFGRFVDVTRAFDGRGYVLTAKGYVGVIVLPDLQIRIDSKVPVDNLFLMLARAYGLNVQLRSEMTTLDAGDSLLEFVAGVFVGQVDGLVRQGISRGYIDRDEEHAFLRGRLLVGRQIQRGAVAVTRFQQRANEFTADLLENRILQATLSLLLRHYYRRAGLRLLLRRALSAFSEVTPAAVRPTDCDRVIYTRLNRRYEPTIRLARLLLQLLSPEGHEGPTPFPAFLLPMHDVFEKFVANTFVEAFAGRPEWRVLEQPLVYLAYDRKEPGNPDLVLHRDGRAAVVIDTKYKEFGTKPVPADRNQMLAYCRALGVGQGILLYPDAADARTQRRLIAGPDEVVHLTLRAVSLAGKPEQFWQRWLAFVHSIAEEMVPAAA